MIITADQVRARGIETPALTRRWTPCRLHPAQYAYYMSKAKVNVAAAGRRCFKTEASKRRVVRDALSHTLYPDAQFFACAPTHQQAKDIFWRDLKLLVPEWALSGPRHRAISESELRIDLINGACIRVAGLDKPERIEGGDWDGGVVTEYGNCRPDVFDEHIRPMLMRGGWIDLEGVPEGRNHYYELVSDIIDGNYEDAEYHHWTAEETLWLYLGREAANRELAQARASMDRLAYEQEYLASFISFEGQAYYAFDSDKHVTPEGKRVLYQPGLPLIFMMDFNRRPGVALVGQEQDAPDWLPEPHTKKVTAVIDEIYIRRNSNTGKVCNEFARRWGDVHEDEVHMYGDPAGGAKTSSSIDGSDWEIATEIFKPIFGHRLKDRVAKAHPPVRVRVNSVNTRLESADGTVGTVVDGKRCPNFIRDMEGVEADAEGNIIKIKGGPLTHLSDAYGYYTAEKHPCGGGHVLTRIAS